MKSSKKIKSNCTKANGSDTHIDLLGMSRYELVDLACNMRRRGQIELLKKLHELENGKA